MAPKARQAKGKARLNSYDKLLNEDQKEREEKLEIFIPNGPRLGNKVIEAQGVAKAYGDKLLYCLNAARVVLVCCETKDDKSHQNETCKCVFIHHYN